MSARGPNDREAMALPLRAGAGLKPEHYRAILDAAPDIGWFEIHAENYMASGCRSAGAAP